MQRTYLFYVKFLTNTNVGLCEIQALFSDDTVAHCAAVRLAHSENDRLLLAQTYDGFKQHKSPPVSFIYFGPEPSNCNELR